MENMFQQLQNNEIPVPNLTLDLTEAAVINNLVGNTFGQDWESIAKQMKIVLGEINETIDNIDIKMFEGLQDDIEDILFTLTGLMFRSGLWNNVAEDWKHVCKSQWTKFDESEEEWIKTKTKYEAFGMSVECIVKTDKRNNKDYWVTLSAIDQLDEKGRECSKGKWLKSYRFKEPTLSTLPNELSERSSIAQATHITLSKIKSDDNNPTTFQKLFLYQMLDFIGRKYNIDSELIMSDNNELVGSINRVTIKDLSTERLVYKGDHIV